MENTLNNSQSKNKTLYIIIAIVAMVLIAISTLYYFQNREMNIIVGNLNEEKTILTEEYQKLILNYDSLHSDNDTLNQMLGLERERIAHLVEEIKTIRATNTAKLREYQKELTTLRGVLRTYIFQIDSLNTRNQELTRENIEHRKRYSEIQTSVRQLETVKATLEHKVSIASRLNITNIEVEGLNANDRKTDRSSRTTKIRVCFTMLKNVTAPVGLKEIYIRIERPDGQLLMHSRDDLFEHEGSNINYTGKRTIEYGGLETDVCVFYNADAGEIIKGKYIVDIFTDGFHIGNHEFSFR